MSKANMVFLDREALSTDTVLRPPDISHRLQVYQRTDITQTAERIQEAGIFIVNKVPLRRAAIEAAKNLKRLPLAITASISKPADSETWQPAISVTTHKVSCPSAPQPYYWRSGAAAL